MTKKAKHGELIEVRVMRERAWAYDRWLERMSWGQMRIAAARHPEEGGLGYDLSTQALRGLVAQARADNGDLNMSREERVERQQVELDALARVARAAVAKAADEGELDATAVKALLDIGKREADLHGLAAPTQIQAEVVHKDAVTEELNDMLVRAGRKPIGAEK